MLLPQTHQLDEQDALDEEEEAIRLQKKRAADLEDDDFMLGGGSIKATSSKSRPATPGTGKSAAAIEKIARNTDALTKEEKLQLIQTGKLTMGWCFAVEARAAASCPPAVLCRVA